MWYDIGLWIGMGEHLDHPCLDANYRERCRNRLIVEEVEVVQKFEGEGEILEVEFGWIRKVVMSGCRNALSMRGLDVLVARELPIFLIRQSEEQVALYHSNFFKFFFWGERKWVIIHLRYELDVSIFPILTYHHQINRPFRRVADFVKWHRPRQLPTVPNYVGGDQWVIVEA